MTGRDRQVVIDEVTTAGAGGRRAGDLAYLHSIYLRWCEANGRAPVLGDRAEGEQQMLLFLHAHHGQWGYAYLGRLAGGVARLYVAGGRSDLRGVRWDRYRKAAHRDLGTRRRPRTDALAADEVKAAANVRGPAALAPLEVVQLRGLLALAELTGQDPTMAATMRELMDLPRGAFTITDLDVKVRCPDGQRRTLDRTRRPVPYAVVVELLDRSDGQYALAVQGRSVRDLVGWMVPGVWARLTGRPGKSSPPRGEVREAWSAATPEARDWWLAHCDPQLLRHARDLLYVYAGINTAHRHAELRRLRIGDVETSRTGFTWTVLTHKGEMLSASHGNSRPPMVKRIDHVARGGPDGPMACPPACPACALDFYLALRRLAGAGDEDPLFLGRGGPITAEGARARMQTLAHDLAASAGTTMDGRVIGTRSLRVTAVTLARMAGMSLVEVSQTVTDHVSAATTELYVRGVDPLGQEHTDLPIRVPASSPGL